MFKASDIFQGEQKMINEDSKKICQIIIRGLKMIVKLLENLLKEEYNIPSKNDN